jgi:hypothetical protein
MNAPRILAALLALVIASCSTMPPPVPIMGTRAAISTLEGSWSGEYWSVATGRSGSIHFTLTAARDTAFGDVLMLPRRTNFPMGTRDGMVQTVPRPSPATLRIAFVHAEGGTISGSLEAYEDPDCGCVLATWFSGVLRGDRIEGRYMSRNLETGTLTSGDWSVKRSQSRPS